MESYLGWIWLGLAVLLGLTELCTGTFMFLLFAVAAALASVLGFLGLPLGLQTVAFLLGCVGALAVAPRLADRANRTTRGSPRFGVDALVDQLGQVTEDIDPIGGTGMIKVDGQVWRARAPQPILAGTLVRVSEVEGTKLVVYPVQSQPEPPSRERLTGEDTISPSTMRLRDPEHTEE